MQHMTLFAHHLKRLSNQSQLMITSHSGVKLSKYFKFDSIKSHHREMLPHHAFSLTLNHRKNSRALDRIA